MAIPITQVPNAPDFVPNAPDIPAMGIPSAGGYGTPTVSAPNFGRASQMIGSAAELLAAPIPEPFYRQEEFVDYASRAVANLGQTGIKVAGMLGDYALNMQKVRDEGTLSKAENLIDSRYAEFADSMSDKPAGTWMKEWNENVVPRLVKEIGGMPISNTGKAKMQVLVDGKLTQHTVNTRLRADKAQMDETDASLVAQRDKLEFMGNWEGAAAIDAKRMHLGLSTQGEYEQNQLEREKRMQAQTIQNFINSDPFEAKNHFAQAAAGGKSSMFENLQPTQLAQALQAANARVTTIQREAVEAIDSEILRDPINADPEKIRSIAQMARLSERDTQQLLSTRGAAYAATPEGQAKFLQAQRELYGEISAYDPTTDLDEEKYRQLRQTVKTKMPTGEWQIFFDTLSDIRSKGRSVQNDIQSDLLSLTGNLRKWGVLGDDGGTDENGKPKNWTKYNEVESKAAEMRKEVMEILKKNPNIDPTEARRLFLESANGKTKGAAGEFFKKKEWNLFSPSTWFSSAMQRQEGMYATLPKVQGDVARQITTEAQRTGTDPKLATLIAYMESGFNPNTKSSTSSARGVFQFLDGDRKRYGGNGIAQGLAKVRENQEVARKALGREPTPAETYVVYFQGIGIGPKILQNPDADFRDTLNTVKKGWANTVIKANPFLAEIQTNADLLRWAEERMNRNARKLGLT